MNFVVTSARKNASGVNRYITLKGEIRENSLKPESLFEKKSNQDV
jgi:hypothetical protein